MYAARIRERWQDTVTAIFDVGRLLMEAKTALPGEFEAMVNEDLPFGARAARMLMAIAVHPILTDRNHGSALPPSWRTLYELTRLPEPVLVKALGDGTIGPETERHQARALLASSVSKQTPELSPREELRRELDATHAKLEGLWETYPRHRDLILARVVEEAQLFRSRRKADLRQAPDVLLGPRRPDEEVLARETTRQDGPGSTLATAAIPEARGACNSYGESTPASRRPKSCVRELVGEQRDPADQHP